MSTADVTAARDRQDGNVGTSGGPRSSRPKHRTFTREYKMRMLDQYEAASSPQERNALLRREGIHRAYITEWRRLRDRTASGSAPEKKKPGRPGKSQAGASGAFSVLRFKEPDLPDVVYIEQLTGALYLDQRTDVEHYLEVVDQLSGEALTPADTTAFIEQAVRET